MTRTYLGGKILRLLLAFVIIYLLLRSVPALDLPTQARPWNRASTIILLVSLLWTVGLAMAVFGALMLPIRQKLAIVRSFLYAFVIWVIGLWFVFGITERVSLNWQHNLLLVSCILMMGPGLLLYWIDGETSGFGAGGRAGLFFYSAGMLFSCYIYVWADLP